LYTRCPHCLTVFMVAAEQLKAAHGNVRCGTCLESFDAIPHLSDGPVQARPMARMENGDGDNDAVDAELAGETVASRSDTRVARERLSSTLDAARVAAAGDGGASPALEHAAELDSHESADDGEDADIELADDAPGRADPWLDHASSATPRRVSLMDESLQDDPGPLPDVLRADAEEFAAQSAARRRNMGYGIAALALLALLAGQYVFFMPEDAARRYPQFRGAIENVCMQVGCVLSERRDPGRIRVLSRDVRVHPRYEGVMQIKATLTNSAPYRQPYPQFQFTLFNVNGQTIATRVFQPSEYLGRPIAASARLRPQTPFQVELDVLAPGEAAVSFEFQFL
jgi:predicted Zn finger-like uncharacterized protein